MVLAIDEAALVWAALNAAIANVDSEPTSAASTDAEQTPAEHSAAEHWPAEPSSD